MLIVDDSDAYELRTYIFEIHAPAGFSDDFNESKMNKNVSMI